MSEVTNDAGPIESPQTVLTSRAIFMSAANTALAYLECEPPMVESAIERLKQAFDEDAELDSAHSAEETP